jgi:phosphoribosylformylglycinamidine synthase
MGSGMKCAVIVFPGSNCDRDAADALTRVTGRSPVMVWHKDGDLPEGLDLVVLPGGFSYGDYLRSGAMAAASPVASAIRRHADRGGFVLAICNGFQVATELRLLPGALLRNAGLTFVCRPQRLSVATDCAFTSCFGASEEVVFPIAHHDGNFFAEASMLDRLEGEGRVAFRYVGNPNGSQRDIAGVLSENRRVLGLMPHPERVMGGAENGADGLKLFQGLMAAV